MHIGIDFDNTIVNYDKVFYRAALEREAVPSTIDPTKLAVRDWLRAQGKENVWTEMQGNVYGARMADAEVYPGVLEFLRWARSEHIPLSIVSQKTVRPFLGPNYDLHKSARMWIAEYLHDGEGPLVALQSVYFEITREKKWARIAATAITHFIDDLPEILTAKAFPLTSRRILFDPEHHHNEIGESLIIMHDWKEVLDYFKGKNGT